MAATYLGGTGFDAVTSAGSTAADATPLPRLAQKSVYVVTSGGPSTGVLFPQSGSLIGDELEIHSDDGSNAYNLWSGAVAANGGAGNELPAAFKRFIYTSAGWFG